MKKKAVGILLGMTVAIVSLTGCGSNEATEAANESAEIEDAGKGEDVETEAVQEEEKKAEENGDAEGTAGEETEEEPAVKVAVLLPDERTDVWASDGEELSARLTEDGYDVELVFAQNDSEKQVSQIKEMMGEEVGAMIIAPVDEYGLTDVLAEVKEADIPVFSYDKLIRDTDGVEYYVTFSGRSMGKMVAEEIVKQEELDKIQENKESRTIEFLMGSFDDVQALFFYNGVMEVLQPYLDDGTLLCRSGQLSFEDTGILRWGRERAQKELQEIVDEFYQDIQTPDIIVTGYDDAACGAVDALEEAGLSSKNENWPIITGSGCSADAVTYIAEGRISCSVFADRRNLAEECVKMVDTYLKGDTPEVNNYEEYDNGVKIISTYMCDVQLIDDGNYESLIDNGYYREEEIEPKENDVYEGDGQTEEGERTEEEAAKPEDGSLDVKDSEENDGKEKEETSDLQKDIPEDSILSILGESKSGL